MLSNMDYLLDIAARFTVAAILGGSIATLTSVIFERRGWRTTLTLTGALALVGASAGIAGGMSRIGVVGDIVPAILGLLGAVAVYLFGIDKSRGTIASLGAVALSISFVTGYALASQYRNSNSSDYREIRAICAAAYSDPNLLADPTALAIFEKAFQDYCPSVLEWHVPDND